MYIYERGEGEAVVLLHGANPVSYFNELVAALAENYRVVVPHLPGWGKSQPLPEGQDFEATDAALGRALREADLGRAAIVGYSLGGWRALELALSRTLEFRSIYLLSTFTPSPSEELRQVYRGYAELARSPEDLRPAVRNLYLPPDFAAEHPDIHDEVTDWVYACPRDVFARELDAVASMPDLLPRLPELETPVVARVGTLDIAAPVEWSRSVVETVPHGRLELVEGCGHALLYENTAETIASVLNAV